MEGLVQVKPREEVNQQAAAVSSGDIETCAAREEAISSEPYGEEVTLPEESSLLRGCLQPAGTALLGSLRPEQDGPAGRLPCVASSPPPIRLRFFSHDSLCARSMEVSWDAGSGARQEWSSWGDQFSSSFASEKLLPAGASNIRVEFKTRARVVGGESVTVYAVDRQKGCQWRRCEAGRHVPEVILFRATAEDLHEPIDVVFELTGPLFHCYVWRAWNASRGLETPPRSWEFWQDEASKPMANPLPVALIAADRASSVHVHPFLDPHDRLQACAQRLVAAARALLDVRRQTLTDLECLDKRLGYHWFAINSTNTLSVGLGAASVAAFFVSPPAGIALGVGSMATGTAAQATDFVSDEAYLQSVRAQLSKDAWNAFAVAELEVEWLKAYNVAGAVPLDTAAAQPSHDVERVGVVGCRVVGASATAANAVVHTALPATAKALGFAGVFVSAGIAVHGWATDKALRIALRKKRSDLAASMLALQRWLASMRLLECPLCTEKLHISHLAVQCRDSWHCIHSSCMRKWVAEQGQAAPASCPLCSGDMEPGERVLSDILENTLRSHVADGSAS
mmetsp:Transcript_66715/g.124638  ORF Transcript_66715/g.124638 Transcript_66715/m.124638 type:complete len:567 (-) Transcript_66715:80-1780(-)